MMNYKEMAEIVTREVEIKFQKKRKRVITIKRIALTTSSLCVAIIVCFGAWHNDGIKNALKKDILVQQQDSIATESDMSTSVVVTTTTAPNTSSNERTTTTYTDKSHSTINDNATVTTTKAMNQLDTNMTVTQPVTTDKNNETHDTTEIVPVVTTTVASSTPRVTTTAPKHTAPPIVSSTVEPPPDRTTATTASGNTETTTTTTDQNLYSFRINFIDDKNFEPVNNVNAKLVQQKIEWIDNETRVDVGDGIVVAEWNSSDNNPYLISFIKENEIKYRYTIIVDILPPEYSFYGENSVEYNISGYFEEENNIEILLSNEQTTTNSIPLEGTYSLKLKVLDIISNTSVQNLDCELFCVQTNEVVAAWNTSTTEELYIENLQYSFDKTDSCNGNITYAIRILNMPENYCFFYGKSKVEYGISGFGLEEFANGTELNCIAYLEDTSEDAPKYNYN